MQQLMAMKPKVTAVFASSDVQALGEGMLGLPLGIRRLRSYTAARDAHYCLTRVTKVDLSGVEADIEVLNRARIENVPGYIVRLEAVGSSPETAQIRITMKFRAEHAPVKLEEITGVLSALEQS